MSSLLYVGQVMHARKKPVEYKFNYGTLSIKVDIDTIEQEASQLRWLSLNKFNLVGLNYKDHGSRDGKPWRQWVNEFLALYGIAEPARVELLCYPRILGYSFNPLSMWYAYDKNNQLIAVIGEVSNTFKKWHHYVLKSPDTSTDTIEAVADKVFHVSPFIDMDARYHFRLRTPSERIYTYIRETRNEEGFFYASQTGKAVELTNSNLLKQVGFAPFHALKVIGLIHWWALKILIKGGRFHKTPKQLQTVQYSHSEMKSC